MCVRVYIKLVVFLQYVAKRNESFVGNEIHKYICIYKCVCIYLYACMYVFMYIRMDVCICLYTY